VAGEGICAIGMRILYATRTCNAGNEGAHREMAVKKLYLRTVCRTALYKRAMKHFVLRAECRCLLCRFFFWEVKQLGFRMD